MTATVTVPLFRLGQGDQRDLEASGLTTTTIQAAGLYSASGAEASALLGYGVGPGLVFPYEWNGNGTPTYARVKLNDAGPDGKRYRSPLGRGNRLYAPSRLLDRALLVNPRLTLHITEGEKKTLRAIQEGLLCLGLSGVWAWRQKGVDGTSVVIEDLDRIAWTGRDVRIVFDSDAAQNPKVREAERALSAELTRRGAVVTIIRLPAGPEDAKQGLDDFLEVHGGAAFLALPLEPPEPIVDAPLTSASLADILAVEPATLCTPFIAEPWIPEGGLVTLAAAWGVGKGKLSQDLCLARASGGHWLGVPVAPGPALFWSGEQGRREDFRVTQALCRGRGLASAAQVPHFFEVIYDPALRFASPAMFALVMARVRAHPGLLVAVDSLRRAFAGDENDSAASDAFYQTTLRPLRAAGATVLLLAHPPKTSGQTRRIEDDNMVRGSGDWAAQVDSSLVLRRLTRSRTAPDTERIVLRLTHAKARGSWEAPPYLVTLLVTHDRTPLVTFTITGELAGPEATGAELEGAVKAAATLCEERRRLSRKDLRATLQLASFGRPSADAAVAKLLQEGVIRGPLAKEERPTGERGHWFAFVKPLPIPPPAAPDGEEHDDEPV